MQNLLKLHFFQHTWEGEEKQKTNLPILNIHVVLFLTKVYWFTPLLIGNAQNKSCRKLSMVFKHTFVIKHVKIQMYVITLDLGK